MFCRIKYSEKTEMITIYLCERIRKEGKTLSNDIKIVRWNYFTSLYEYNEEKTGLVEDLPGLTKDILKMKLKNKQLEKYFDVVVEKLINFKKEKYTTFKDEVIKCNERYEKEKEKNKIKRIHNFEKFKKDYRDLLEDECTLYFERGYMRGKNETTDKGKNDISNLSDQERKLLKQAFKLLSNKHHPDKGGDTETMATINNLKEKILK